MREVRRGVDVTVFIGCDPGLSGAVARLDSATGNLRVEDMPTVAVERNGKSKRDIDHFALARMLDEMASEARTQFAIEAVGAGKGQGTSSMFAFGRAYGVLIGCAAATFCPIEFVAPAVWKRMMSVTSDKNTSLARASELFPAYVDRWKRKKDDGRAEAVLLAKWLMEKKNGRD